MWNRSLLFPWFFWLWHHWRLQGSNLVKFHSVWLVWAVSYQGQGSGPGRSCMLRIQVIRGSIKTLKNNNKTSENWLLFLKIITLKKTSPPPTRVHWSHCLTLCPSIPLPSWVHLSVCYFSSIRFRNTVCFIQCPIRWFRTYICSKTAKVNFGHWLRHCLPDLTIK